MTQTNQPQRRRYNSPQDELLDRVRRVETRLTKYLEFQGFDTQTAKATWSGDRVVVPTPAVSFRDVLAVIPEGWAGRPVLVFVGEEYLATVQVPFTPV